MEAKRKAQRKTQREEEMRKYAMPSEPKPKITFQPDPQTSTGQYRDQTQQLMISNPLLPSVYTIHDTEETDESPI